MNKKITKIPSPYFEIFFNPFNFYVRAPNSEFHEPLAYSLSKLNIKSNKSIDIEYVLFGKALDPVMKMTTSWLNNTETFIGDLHVHLVDSYGYTILEYKFKGVAVTEVEIPLDFNTDKKVVKIKATLKYDSLDIHCENKVEQPEEVLA